MFTYDLATNVGRVRLYLGDNTESQGVLPGGANFTDEEIELVLAEFSDSVGSALVRLARSCATKWASAPQSFIADGLRINRGDPVKKWQSLAEQFAKDFNVSADFGRGVSFVDLLREDRYEE